MREVPSHINFMITYDQILIEVLKTWVTICCFGLR